MTSLSHPGLGEGGAKGVIDLARWRIDVGGTIRLRGNILTGLVIETVGPPVVPFRIRGPVDDPAVNVDTRALKVRRVVIPDPKDLDLRKTSRTCANCSAGSAASGSVPCAVHDASEPTECAAATIDCCLYQDISTRCCQKTPPFVENYCAATKPLIGS